MTVLFVHLDLLHLEHPAVGRGVGADQADGAVLFVDWKKSPIALT
jgi:hypothetical protein